MRCAASRSGRLGCRAGLSGAQDVCLGFAHWARNGERSALWMPQPELRGLHVPPKSHHDRPGGQICFGVRGAVNEMVTSTPCEGYAFAECFISETITMSELAMVGIDLGKHTFHLHATRQALFAFVGIHLSNERSNTSKKPV